MNIDTWWQKAVSVGQDLRNSLNNPVGPTIAKKYKVVRDVLFNDSHHAPSTEKGSTLQKNLQEWTRDVEKHKYDNRFAPSPPADWAPPRN